MRYADSRLAKAIMEMRAEEALQQAESRRLLLQAGIEPRQDRRLACQLGHLLVALGKRLERYSLTQSFPLEGEMSRGR